MHCMAGWAKKAGRQGEKGHGGGQELGRQAW